MLHEIWLIWSLLSSVMKYPQRTHSQNRNGRTSHTFRSLMAMFVTKIKYTNCFHGFKINYVWKPPKVIHFPVQRNRLRIFWKMFCVTIFMSIDASDGGRLLTVTFLLFISFVFFSAGMLLLWNWCEWNWRRTSKIDSHFHLLFICKCTQFGQMTFI